jgi:hypothetical protein
VLTKDYLAWNQVLFEKFYSEQSAGMPVYLDLEDSVLDEFATHPLLVGAGSVDDLVKAVRSNIDFSLNKDQVFLKIENETLAWIRTFWRTHGEEKPPMLPLLALTVLAAERMGGDGSASNAYYKHFNEILGVSNPKQQESVQESYRKTIIFLWKALNRWLTDRQGLNGEYTAYSLSYAHIGAAMSQALIRDVDRKKLPRMFEYLRLEPGSQVSIPDMKELFAVWLTKDEGGVTQSLRNLWTKESARNGIAEVLCAELSKWDGTTKSKTEGSSQQTAGIQIPSKLRVTLRHSSKLMKKRYDFGLGFNPSSTDALASQEYSLIDNQAVTATVVAKSQNLSALVFGQGLKAENILEGKIKLLSGSGSELRRLPKNLVLLSRDEDSGLWVEGDRASLGQELTLLVRLDSNAWQSLLTFLSENARPGFEFASSESIGLPEGWGLIEFVQIIDIGTISGATEDLRSLVPVSGSQLAFRGGLRLPSSGSFKYWLTSKPPIIEAIAQPGSTIKMDVYRLELEADIFMGSSTTAQGILSFDLAGYETKSGNYRVTLFEGKSAIAQREFYLRDSNQPDPISSRTRPRLGHSTKQSPFAYVSSATELEADDIHYVSGLYSAVDLKLEVEDFGSFGKKSGWLPDEISISAKPSENVFPILDTSSCAFTGRHRWELGTCVANAKYVLGVCNSCGDQKLQMCSAYLAQRAKENKAMTISIQDLPSAPKAPRPEVIKRENSTKFDWVSAYEILQYCVHGTASSLISALETLAIEKTTARQAFSTLEARGAIEVCRDALGKPTRWSLPDKSVVLKEGDNLHFSGPWRLSELKDISATAGAVLRHSSANATPEPFIHVADVEVLNGLLPGEYKDLISNLELWRALPKLSSVREDAPRQVLPAFHKFDQLDLSTGMWVESDRQRPMPGAFRALTKTGVRYYYANEKDLNNGKAVSNSATIVKWFAANEHEVELLAYSEEDQALYVPLGAQLPPFYARALAQVSCELPKSIRTNTGKSLTKYGNVPSIIASALKISLTQ